VCPCLLSVWVVVAGSQVPNVRAAAGRDDQGVCDDR
jgi:hypothetical protein